MQFTLNADVKRQFEEQSAKLNLSPSAYLLYLMTRSNLRPDEATRMGRHVRDVFGKHGDLMRRLAK